MALNLEGLYFEGPYQNKDSLKDQRGIYLVVKVVANKNHIIDVGISDEVRTRLKNHEREGCWLGQTTSPRYAVHYHTNESANKRTESNIRRKYNPPCGKI